MAVSHVEEESSKKTCWKLYFNGVSNDLGHEISVLLITPEGEYCSYMAKLVFNCTNNMAVVDKGITSRN